MSSTVSPEHKASIRISRQDYHRQYDESGQCVELIDGLVYQMTPSSPRHANALNRLARRIARQVDDRQVIIRTEQPLHLGEASDPEPDVASVRGPEARYDLEHPGRDDVLLIVEVSDTSVRHNRTIKVPLYAANEIPEVWIVNLKAREAEVFRQPLSRERRYQHVAKFAAGALPEPLNLPGLALRLEDVLPAPGRA
jgi:Uma2 family endonuclease